MVLKILLAASQQLPLGYAPHALAAVVVFMFLRAISQGRRTSRDRDLHARVVLITGGFTPLGLTLIQNLAQRGAHIIALTPDTLPDQSPSDTKPASAAGTPSNSDSKPDPNANPYDTPLSDSDSFLDNTIPSDPTSLIISALRAETSNPNIYAEHCDLNSPASIRAFCTKFLSITTGEKTTQTGPASAPSPGSGTTEQRLDAIIFAHEYAHIGALPVLSSGAEADAMLRETCSLSTFLLTTLLLPLLLIAPAERDIRIINVVNRFYAAAAAGTSFNPEFKTFNSTPTTQTQTPSLVKHGIFVSEGTRSLRTILFTRHLQRILDALPAPQAPPTSSNTSAIPVVNPKAQKSNIVAISVSPGISRADTIAGLLNADRRRSWSTHTTSSFSYIGLLLYLVLQPLLHIFTRSSYAAIQSILHALFLPTPFKLHASSSGSDSNESGKVAEEALRPGALYAECAVVRLDIKSSLNETAKTEASASKSEKGVELEDDGEYGGERLGRMTWEAYERGLKAWEASETKSGGVKGE